MSKTRFIDIDGKVYNADSCVPLNNAWNQGDIELHTLVRGTYPGHQLSNKELSGIKVLDFGTPKRHKIGVWVGTEMRGLKYVILKVVRFLWRWINNCIV